MPHIEVLGIAGAEPFFQKRVPENHPGFIDTATLRYASGTSAKEAVIRDAAGHLAGRQWPG